MAMAPQNQQMSETDVLYGTSTTWYQTRLFSAHYWHHHLNFLHIPEAHRSFSHSPLFITF